MSEKTAELSSVLKPVHFDWFSHYLVTKRASIEPNFHAVYIALLDALNDRQLTRAVLAETLKNVRAYLSAESTLGSSQERTLLKHLAAWLGRLTLAKDQPIRHEDLAVKVIILLFLFCLNLIYLNRTFLLKDTTRTVLLSSFPLFASFSSRRPIVVSFDRQTLGSWQSCNCWWNSTCMPI